MLSRLLCLACLTLALSAQTPQYVGSAACKTCHADLYTRWSKTRMANVVRDPKEHPEAIIPDLTKPDPLLTFTRDDIAVGRHPQDLAPLFRARGNRLVGSVLSRRQHETAYRAAVRWMPLGQLQHPEQDRY
jgi:hypothetical protein